jgi:hypothetical protein
VLDFKNNTCSTCPPVERRKTKKIIRILYNIVNYRIAIRKMLGASARYCKNKVQIMPDILFLIVSVRKLAKLSSRTDVRDLLFNLCSTNRFLLSVEMTIRRGFGQTPHKSNTV